MESRIEQIVKDRCDAIMVKLSMQIASNKEPEPVIGLGMRKYSTGIKLKNGLSVRKDISPGATSGISFKSRP